MTFKKIFMLICLIICLFSMASVCASEANDTAMASENSLEIDQPSNDVINVEKDTDLASSEENEILTADEQTFTQLNQTINGNEDTEIYLNSDYKYVLDGTDYSFNGGIEINRDVTIYGNGHTISGNYNARIFQVNGGNVVFHNIIFASANAGHNDGGAVNGNCKAINCTFTGNEANNGGAMNYGSAVNCTFTGNTAWICGGALYGNCKAINCTFTGNKANNHGGAMYHGSAVNCNFTENYAFSEGGTGGGGGAIYDGSAINCIFTSNIADDSSGGAMNYGSAVNCTFTRNIARFTGGAIYDGSAVNCTFTENSVEVMGGAMFAGTAVNCTFTGNTAQYGSAMKLGYKLNCRGSDEYDETTNLVLRWDANDFTSIHGSGQKLPVRLVNQIDKSVNFISYDMIIYKDNVRVNAYHCLSGDDVSLDLLPGIYTAELTATYPGLNQPEPKNITITLFDGTGFWGLNRTINNNSNEVINLEEDYAYNPIFDSAFVEGIIITRPVTINGNGAVIDAKGNAKMFTVQSENVTFKNITFKNGKSSSNFGGAIYFKNGGSLFDCTFMNNTAEIGGAVYLYSGNSTVHCCTFINNTAFDSYSAIQLSFGNGSVNGCVFMDNIAGNGVVGTDSESHGQIEIANNIFLNNTVIMDVINFACNENLTTDYNWFGNVAKDYNNGVPSQTTNVWLFLNATSDSNLIPISGSSVIVFKLYAYNKTNLSSFDYDNSLLMPVQFAISAINGTIDREAAIFGESIRFTPTNIGTGRVTAEMGNVSQSIDLEIIKGNSTLTIGDITLDYNGVGSSKMAFTNALGVDAYVIGHKEATVKVTDNAITVSGLNVGTYTLSVTTVTDGNYNNVTKNATITVNKAKTGLTAKAITTTYNKNKYLVITLKDGNGKAISGVKISINLNGAKTYTTDKNGQVKINVAKLVPKAYTAKIAFAGNINYLKSSANVKVTVKKAKAKIIAKKKTYKATSKTKKFTITLKDSKGKPIKNAKVSLKVIKITKKSKKKTKSKKKNKAYIVKTNKKGKATFKVKRTKKAKYMAIIKFAGNKYYNKVTKKVKITIK